MNKLNCEWLTRTCHTWKQVTCGDAAPALQTLYATIRYDSRWIGEKQNNQHMRHLTSRLRARPGHGHGQLRDSIRTKALRGGVAAPLVLLALASTVPVVQGTGV